ncbi:MAG: prepilin-type N-terminal cleavage/methylation domain-containing protein [Verrucomicrobia bacterium]|nr:prepilin-type N-terminal cleavage/methylation domain-containing protein [Verrucomicrobiota bacterium]MBU1734670.1 prepilin-type N-terminal cleavage/methylation domain-containing protein [Verrucomicrobiota bacterium]MBU1856128.1 prepilin-type N-terminal cleavage/methylation domain-containing protein [Verrucomicrobiota bacterium]
MIAQLRTIMNSGQKSEVSGSRSDQSLASVFCLPSSGRRHSDQGWRPSSVVCRLSSGFTLIELLVAVALLGMAMAMTFTTFYSVSKAWQRGTAMADDLDHGEYVMQQIVCGLRSSFFPPSGGQVSTNTVNTNAANNSTNAVSATPTPGGGYGFVLEDHGNGTDARDIISWVKTGTALLRLKDPLSKGLHRVRLSIEDDGDAGSAVAVRAWRPYANSITFDPMEIDPHFVSGKVVGLDCRVAKEMKDDKWDWMEVWEDAATNCLPLAVEITLYLEPLDRNEPPVEIQRTIEIPVAPLSWVGVQKKP